MQYNSRYTNQDRDRENNEYYSNHINSPLGNVLRGVIAIGAVAGLGYGAFKSGAAKDIIHNVIGQLGKYRGTKLGAISQGMKQWASNADEVEMSLLRKDWLNNLKNLVKNGTRKQVFEDTARDWRKIGESVRNAEAKYADGVRLGVTGASTADELHWLHQESGFMRDFKNYREISNKVDAIAGNGNSKVTNLDAKNLRQKMRDDMIKRYTVDAKEQQEMLRVSGYRHLTLGDMFDRHGNIKDEQGLRSIIDEKSYNEFVETLQAFTGKTADKNKWRNMKFDNNLLIDEKGQISDLRVYQASARNFLDNISNNFQIPFIGINPMKLFYVNRLAEEEKPIFAILNKNSIQLGVTGSTKGIEDEMFFINGNVFGKGANGDYDFAKPLATGMELIDANASRSTVARYLGKMAGIDMKEFEEAAPGTGRSIWSKIADVIDVGKQQDEAEKIKPGNPLTYMSVIDKFFKGIGRPYEKAYEEKTLATLFGDKSGYIAMKRSERLRDIFKPETAERSSDLWSYFSQFFMSRDNVKDATPLSMVPYAFMERLDAGMGSFGLGLSSENKGSAWDIYKNLMLRRVLPIMGGISLWGYINYEADKHTGSKPEDEIATGVANAQMNFAGLRDILGVTDWAKHFKNVLPGGDQITDIPGLGWLDFSKSAKELQDYYTNGVEAVRKGRYWSIGNTPFTGGKVDYYRPNWYRRQKSDWEYTDSLYGSEDEYWANAPIPTPRYPLAPIRHFITNNRWLEEKHYEDRPYMVSEGIQEIKGIPLLGPVLNSTIGRVLKAPIKMHQDYWDAIESGEPMPDQQQSMDTSGNQSYTEDNGNYSSGSTGIPVSSSGTSGGSGGGSPVGVVSNKRQQEIQMSEAASNSDDMTTVVYTTSSGNVQVMDAPGRLEMRQLNTAIKSASLAKTVRGVRAKYLSSSAPDAVRITEVPQYSPPGRETAIDINELGGIYGFSASEVLGVEDNNYDELATPDDMQSIRDSFWEENMGGIGGEFSEIMRRFIPRDKNKMNEFNPVRNTQPKWVPGSDYFLDLQHGDPYRIPFGEIRLPGEAYEKINNLGPVMDLKARGSIMGYTKDEMVKYFFHDNDVMSEATEDAAHEGDRIHQKYQKQWAKDGTLIDGEILIENKELNFSGHYDARVIDNSVPQGQAIVDIKTVSQKRWDEMMEQGKPFDHHIGQVNAYLNTMNLPKGYIMYVNRDSKEEQTKTFDVWYDPKLWEQQKATLTGARNEVMRQIDTGERGRGDLYDYFTRWKILADTAPYSKEYKEYSSLLSQIGLTDEQKKEVQEIKHQITERKHSKRMYDYRFATANLKYESVHVTQVLKNDMFLTEEYPDNPIRLAGISVSSAKDNPTAKAAGEYIGKYIHKGSKVTIGYDADEARKISKDTYGTIRSVVKSGNTNINNELLKRQLATEKENDFSPAAVHARFTPNEIGIGAAWERIAHLNTFINTKFMQVRSPLEQYERRDVYGKDFQDWGHPLRDYLQPAIESIGGGSSTPVKAAFFGAIAGMLFGKTTYGKVVGAAVGAGIAGGFSAYTHGKEIATGKRWIPERREKERDINEYVDMLKFLKARRLYEDYAQQALDKEGFDVKAYMSQKQKDGEERKKEKQVYEQAKHDLKVGKVDYNEALKTAGIDISEVDKMQKERAQAEKAKEELEKKKAKEQASKTRRGPKPKPKKPKPKPTKEEIEAQRSADAMMLLNGRISQIENFRQVEIIPPLATKAIQYYQQSEKTMYGYDQGDSLMNAMAALPKKEREYFQAFVDAPEEEKAEILSITPRYMRRMLESSWGLPVENKPDLVEYFKTHNLPSASWEGWKEETPLDVVKTKIVQHSALDATEFNIWDDDKKIANQSNVRAPQIDLKSSALDAKRKLEDILHGIGLEDIQVDVEDANHGRMDVQVDIKKDRKQDIQDWLKEHGNLLLS